MTMVLLRYEPLSRKNKKIYASVKLAKNLLLGLPAMPAIAKFLRFCEQKMLPGVLVVALVVWEWV